MRCFRAGLGIWKHKYNEVNSPQWINWLIPLHILLDALYLHLVFLFHIAPGDSLPNLMCIDCINQWVLFTGATDYLNTSHGKSSLISKQGIFCPSTRIICYPLWHRQVPGISKQSLFYLNGSLLRIIQVRNINGHWQITLNLRDWVINMYNKFSYKVINVISLV